LHDPKNRNLPTYEKTIKSEIWRQYSKRGNYQRTSGKGLHVRNLRKPPNLKDITTRNRNVKAENHKIFLKEFPKVSFEQKLQTTEAFMHAHVDAKHIALSKLQ